MAKQKTKKVNKKQTKQNIHKRGKKVKKLMIVFSLTLIIAFLTYGLVYFFTESKFNIKTIEIKNNDSKYTNDIILQKLEKIKEKNIFLVNRSKIFELVSEYTYIQDVKILKREGSKIVLNIVSAKPKYLVYNEEINKYIVLDQNGTILEVLKDFANGSKLLPTFGIVIKEDVKLRDSIEKDEMKKIKLYETIEKVFADKVENVQITSVRFIDQKVSIVVDYSLSIILEEKELDYDISNIPQILEEIKGSSGILDMTEPSPIYTPKVN